jgi:hypothetical protein
LEGYNYCSAASLASFHSLNKGLTLSKKRYPSWWGNVKKGLKSIFLLLKIWKILDCAPTSAADELKKEGGCTSFTEKDKKFKNLKAFPIVWTILENFFYTFKIIYCSVLPFVRGLLEFLKVKGPKTEKFDFFVIKVVSVGAFFRPSGDFFSRKPL